MALAEPFVVETFRLQFTADTMPPSVDWVEAQLAEKLPSGAQVLQWAIVKANPESREVWIEGSASVPVTG